jgi:hypothetical protein
MNFLRDPGDDHRKVLAGIQRYEEYLASVRRELPREVFELASSRWRFDFTDHRCLHDSWIESVSIDEGSQSDALDSRSVEITMRLLGAYHDGHTILHYSGVKSYQLAMNSANRRSGGELNNLAITGHGDWLMDEIRLGNGRDVIHEILLSTGVTWVIVCTTIHYSTTIRSEHRD